MGERLEVLYSDNHLLAVDKPAGIPTVPDASGDESLYDLARRWVEVTFEKPGRAWLGVCHRLDRPVSGVVLFARTSKAAARLSEQIRSRSATKLYWGVGSGRLPEGAPRSGESNQWLLKDDAKNRVRPVAPNTPEAKLATTRWRVLAEERQRTLYELVPVTGRSHQLRALVRALGTPLLGDLKYGAAEPLVDRSVALHARMLEVDHPTRAERVRMLSNLPRLPCWEFDELRM